MKNVHIDNDTLLLFNIQIYEREAKPKKPKLLRPVHSMYVPRKSSIHFITQREPELHICVAMPKIGVTSLGAD